MPANPSTGPDADDSGAAEAPPEHLSRAERRAAARGRSGRDTAPPWSTGKVAGSRGPAPARRQYTNRRTGG